MAKYRVLDRIGKGSMGAVYRAHDTVLDRQVAIKIIDSAWSDAEKLEQRFKREMKALISFSHPNVVKLLDAGTMDGRLYYVMEYVDGWNLKGLVDSKGPLPRETLMSTLDQLLDALEYVHTRGVIHRDIKPANVMIDVSGRAILLDFGLARMAQAATLTVTGECVGSVAYLAPELLKAAPAAVASDLWSVGVVVYEIATASTPFSRESVTQLVNQILHHDPVPLHRLRDDLSPEYGALIMRFLEKDPDRRWPSAKEARTALAAMAHCTAGIEVLSQSGAVAALHRAPERTQPISQTCADGPRASETASLPAPPQPRQPGRPTRRRRSQRTFQMSAVLAAAMLTGFLLAWVANRPGSRSAAPEPAPSPARLIARYDRIDRLSVEFATATSSVWTLAIASGGEHRETVPSSSHRFDVEIHPWRPLGNVDLVCKDRRVRVPVPPLVGELAGRLGRAVKTANLAPRVTNQLYKQLWRQAAALDGQLSYWTVPELAKRQPRIVKPVADFVTACCAAGQLAETFRKIKPFVGQILLSGAIPDAQIAGFLETLWRLDLLDALAVSSGLPAPLGVQDSMAPAIQVTWQLTYDLVSVDPSGT
ncbi:MAG: serine/threonine protein kinase, partial [Candidatus Riflebacteria bacterium]|nr:serine/threonine protein kinase [Candidatus Riflebacteria bacterium]